MSMARRVRGKRERPRHRRFCAASPRAVGASPPTPPFERGGCRLFGRILSGHGSAKPGDTGRGWKYRDEAEMAAYERPLEDPLVEKHYVSKRSRSQKGVLAFLAQDAQTRVFCYANAELRKEQRDDEILRFVDFWKRRTGHLPEELIFDSKLTTYAKLSELNRKGIPFITLRRRSKNLLAEIARTPPSAWRPGRARGGGMADSRWQIPKARERRIWNLASGICPLESGS